MIGRRGNTKLRRNDVLDQARAARAARARSRGTAMFVLGVTIVALLCALGFLLDYGAARGGHASPIPTWVLPPIAFLVAGPLLIRGRRYRMEAAQDVLAHDERPPIVYLRPFEADRVTMVQRGAAWRSRRRRRVRHTMNLLTTKAKTYEQRLAEMLHEIAPFVTFGDPTERLPQLGANRLYARDTEWQHGIDELLSRGGTIILHIGASAGIAWEVERILALGEPQRVILSLPLEKEEKHSREEIYAGFRSRFGGEFPRGLPDEACQTQFLYFDEGWMPCGAPLWVRLATYCLGGLLVVVVLALAGGQSS